MINKFLAAVSFLTIAYLTGCNGRAEPMIFHELPRWVI